MSHVKSVSIDPFVLPEVRNIENRKIIEGGKAEPAAFFFGHSMTVSITGSDLTACRLYWAEKTNMPIIDQQSADYFIDMYHLHPDANTFTTWKKKKPNATESTIKVTDIPAMPGGTGVNGIVHRWLEIVAIVQHPEDDYARKAHFRQDLVYYPAGVDSPQQIELCCQQHGLATNFAQSANGIRNYSYQILENNIVIMSPGGIDIVFTGTPANLR
jgi:hypothetical protein